MIKKGHIFRLEENEAVIMTKDLDFYKVKRSSGMLFLGQEISFSKSDILLLKNNRANLIKYGALISSIAAIFIVLFFAFFQPTAKQHNDIYAYIDVDTNLSLSLAIDDKNNVLDVNPINDDTRVLMEDLDLKSKNINDALSDIIKKSNEKGFSNLTSNGYVLISAALNSDIKGYKLSKEYEQKFDKLLDKVNTDIIKIDNVKLNSKVIKVDPKIRELASEKNVSMGRYVTYIETRERGIDITIDEAREGTLKEILNKAEDNIIVDAEYDTSIRSNEKKDDTTKNNNTNNNINSSNSKNLPSSPKPNIIIPTPYDRNKRTSFRPIPSSYAPEYTNNIPTVFNTPSPESTLTTQVSVQTPVPRTEQRTIPVDVKTPIRTFLPPRTIMPFSTPVPYDIKPSEQIQQATPTTLTNPIPTESKITPTTLVIAVPTPTLTPNNSILVYNASNITSFSAVLSGEVISLVNFNTNINNYVKLIYWETYNPRYIHTATSIMSQNLPLKVSATIEGLKPATYYQYQIIVNGYFFSNIGSFNTLAPPENSFETPKPWQGYWPNPNDTHQ